MPDDLDRDIIEYLLVTGEHTLPQIAKAVKTPVGTVDYRLKKMVEKQVIIVYEPPVKAVRTYGKKYRVNSELNPTEKLPASLVITITSLIISIVVFQLNLLVAFLFLLPPSIIGLAQTVNEYRGGYIRKTNELLEKL